MTETRLVFEELGPRVLLSADPLAVVADSGVEAVHEQILDNNEFNHLSQQYSTEQNQQQLNHKRTELVIIDARVPNFQQLHNDLIKAQQQGRNVHVVILDAHRDGIEQINEALESHNKLDAVHIVSHGDDGQLNLGATQLNKSTLREHSADITSWKDTFTDGGDLLIYGCNLAETAGGKALVNALSQLTATDVAASDDLTGNNILGGDWELEYQAGDIETEVAFSDEIQQNWQGTLQGAAPAAAEQQNAVEEQRQEQQAQVELGEQQAVMNEEDQAAKQEQDEQQAAVAQAQRREIVFIDDSVSEFQSFIDDLQANSDPAATFEIVLLDSEQSGIDQVTETLLAYDDVDALHIISHGSNGSVNLGNTWLNIDNLEQYSDSLNAWGRSLDTSADILIYGCNLAESDQGEQFVKQLAQLSGADVAASDDLTGHGRLGGDWELEYRSGAVETLVALSDDMQQQWMGQLASPPAGGEFRVNSTTAGIQQTQFESPNAVATDASGDFVIVWTSSNGASSEVFAQRYDSAGVALGGEFQVNTTGLLEQSHASVAMDDAGNFVVTWVSAGQDADANSENNIYAQRYNAAGVAQGGEFRVNTSQAGDQLYPTVAMSAFGDFVITWTGAGAGNNDIFAQRYNAAGLAQGGEFRVNSYTTNAQQYSSVAMDDAGRFVITWTSTAQDADQDGVYAQRYDAAGAAQGSEFLVNTEQTQGQAWSTVAMDAAGGFVITWTSLGQDGDANGHGNVYAQRYDAAGVAQGAEFRINSTTTDDQRYSRVAMDAAGNFTVTWMSFGQDGDNTSQSNVYAREYDASGTAQGGEFLVNTSLTGDQRISAVARATTGNYIIVWSGRGSGDTTGVYGQRYDVNDAPVAVNDNAAVAEGGSVLIDLSANDSDIDNALDLNSINIIGAPANGSLIINGDGTVSYTHDGSETLSDSFSYTIADISGAISNTATVNITVTAVNDSPVAGNDAAAVAEGNSVIIDLAANDSDVDTALDLNSINIIGAPANGSLLINADGTVVYTHDGSNTASDAFTYTIADINGAISNTAKVNITVILINDAPTTTGIADIMVNEDSASTHIDLNAAFADTDNPDSELTYSITGNNNVGLFSATGIDGSTGLLTLDYAANMNGSAQISIRAMDPSGLSVDTLFTVNVDPVNDNPAVIANTGTMTTGVTPAAISNNELNATDIDNLNSELVYTITALPVNGSLLLNGVEIGMNDTFTQADIDNNLIAYLPSGRDTFDQFAFTVSDSTGTTLGENTFGIAVQLRPDDDESVSINTNSPVSSKNVTAANESVSSQVGDVSKIDGEGGYGGEYVPLKSSSAPAAQAPLRALTIDPMSSALTGASRRAEPGEKTDKVSSFAAVQMETVDALWYAVDRMKEKVASQSAQESGLEFRAVAVESSGVLLSASVIAWILSSGTLFGNLLSNLPSREVHDPLPVSVRKEYEEEILEEKITTSM